MRNLFFSSLSAIVALFLLVVWSSGVSADYPSQQVLSLSNNGYATFDNMQNIPSGSSDRTISVWVKQSSRSESFDATILSFGAGEGACSYREFGMGINPNGHAFVTACNTWTFSHPTKIMVGDWYHIAFTYTLAASFLYVNAMQGQNLGSLLLRNSLVEGFIGMRAVNHAGFFNGYLDNLRIYNIALSATDINNDRIASPKKGLVLHFDMTALGETLIDNNRPNGPNATMNEGASVVISTDDVRPTVQRLSLSSPTDLMIKSLITPTTFLPSGNSDRTFSAWIYRTPDPVFSAAYYWETVLAFSTPNADGSAVVNDQTSLTFGVTNTGSVFLMSGNPRGFETKSLRVEVGKWHHIAASINSTAWTLSVDGISEHFMPDSLITGTKQVSVGVGHYGGFRFNGFIDELHIYQRALTAEEIVYDKDVKEYGLLEGLVARFDGEVNEDNKLTDSIGRLTLSGLKADQTMISPAGGPSIAIPGNGYASFNNVQNIPAGASDRTISVWVKQSYRSLMHDATIISFGAGYQLCDTELAFGINRKGNVMMSVCNQFSRSHPLVITIGEWNHISFTYSNTLQQMNRLYLNAIAEDIGSLSLSTVAREVFIGMRGMSRAEFFTGSLDSLRIYNRALSQFEISADRIGVAGSVSGLVVNILDVRSPNANGTLIDPRRWNTATLSKHATIVSSAK